MTVVLDIGADVGALVLYAPPQLDGAEIEVSPGALAPRTHSVVRQRRAAGPSTTWSRSSCGRWPA